MNPASAAPDLSFDVTEADFRQTVLERSLDVPVLLDCWAPWCGPCRNLKPILEKLAKEYGGRFVLAKLNTDEAPQISAALQIRSIPLVVLFVGGRPVDQFMGALPEGQVRAFLDKHIGEQVSEVDALRAESADPQHAEMLLSERCAWSPAMPKCCWTWRRAGSNATLRRCRRPSCRPSRAATARPRCSSATYRPRCSRPTARGAFGHALQGMPTSSATSCSSCATRPPRSCWPKLCRRRAAGPASARACQQTSGARAEDRGADAHEGGALGDGGFQVGAHAHRQRVQPRPAGRFTAPAARAARGAARAAPPVLGRLGNRHQPAQTHALGGSAATACATCGTSPGHSRSCWPRR
jgi:thioredoxin